MRIECHLDAVAVSVAAKLEALRLPDITKMQRRRLMEAINADIRKYTDCIPHRVSRSAHSWSQGLESPVDLRTKVWHDQPRFDPGRRHVIAEHKVPVGSIISACAAAGTPEAIREVIRQMAIVVWVTREENDRLDSLGFRVKRPDPDAAYAAAQIEVL